MKKPIFLHKDFVIQSTFKICIWSNTRYAFRFSGIRREALRQKCKARKS